MERYKDREREKGVGGRNTCYWPRDTTCGFTKVRQGRGKKKRDRNREEEEREAMMKGGDREEEREERSERWRE